MTKNRENHANPRRESNIWTLEEARSQFDELIAAAAQRGSQRIQDSGREFSLTLVRAKSSPQGKEILGRGGPLDQTDELD
ncbi:hypothetical protein [Chelativorans sp. AA-79]|uniref:hypothetical protein n=1 Tax=Chelativorans sp. AA-79 TaxID=3028735 RepID=UPI0023F962BE|nr:hypothetical protein [Chelativorans sp. AA-79]WEX11687.1 hypothetical protein PVE73_12545 [Chelativorans sp. AA-79]